jgi:putative transposase
MELAALERVHWFNHDRLHESLGDIPPVEVEDTYWAQLPTTPSRSSLIYGSKQAE